MIYYFGDRFVDCSQANVDVMSPSVSLKEFVHIITKPIVVLL
jgi:hypothetical protein